jgi:hypothetical protein
MSSDREIQARRRQAFLEILTGDQKVTEQKELVEQLHARGIPATQSSIRGAAAREQCCSLKPPCARARDDGSTS